MSEVIHYPYSAIVDDIESIYRWCKIDAFVPDVIVGVARGGIVPAVHLSHKFNKPLEIIRWSTRDFEERDTYKWVDIAISSIEGKKYLIVEDIIDSGKTMREMFSSIKEYKQSDLTNIRTVALWYNISQTEFMPDYYTNPISRNNDKRWVVFSWEV